MNPTGIACCLFAVVLSATAVSQNANAQNRPFVANYDEAKIPPYALPDVLGDVKSADDWPAKRAEWRDLIAAEMFGKGPASDAGGDVSVRSQLDDVAILDGAGFLRQLHVQIAGETVRVAMFLPESAKQQPVPVFLGYNFAGNHTVFDHPAIELPTSWMRNIDDHRARDADRGKSSSRWAIEAMIRAGFGLVTIYYGDIDPDFDDGFENGVHKVLGKPADDEAASIATWAWGLSRVLDVLEQVDVVDAKRVAVFGHSRLGKTSLWAGASDQRFALVISNDSGCGGAALSRRQIGETVWRINTSFPHWFCGNFKKYNEQESKLPFDSHVLLSLIAPRPLYVASAVEDRWADPKGEFLSCVEADPVYKLLGTEGLPTTEMPPVGESQQGTIGYHIREGKHDVTDFDWQQYIRFATRHLK
ncbi:acetylxylan esterase [Rhodopirellula sp. MGV]|uniref:glucuronyl esterase domain-containing protein n=1 Tax=Rhodopirellula sp. MGV TaxID=2023130 RepID=UPI000B9714A3|nr:acetylxylan esterase [Rhodopirellula sp. MGV]OYP35001.1 acetylxylan esterase [Rhodopirellula sp. MGV]PNY38103.1 acetylxylan esterase [Rhodopirellula baltica]